jgi:hypothetical protein
MRTRTLAIALALALLPLSVLANDVHFNAPGDIGQQLVVGEEFAYSLCLGRLVSVPKPGQRQLSLNAAQSPCGSGANPSATVWGGNPPYHFTLGSGGFPPMGLVMDNNGVLRGTPRGTTASTFRVCAVDQSANQSCQRITLQPQPANANTGADGNPSVEQGGKSGMNPALLILGGAAALGGGLAAANLAATTDMTNTNTSTCEAGETDCGDGYCCNPGWGCCGVYGSVQKCCPGDHPHYCPSTNKCYRTLPNCSFSLCGGPVAGAPGSVAGVGPAPRTLNAGDPSSSSDGGVPPSLGCPSP